MRHLPFPDRTAHANTQGTREFFASYTANRWVPESYISQESVDDQSLGNTRRPDRPSHPRRAPLVQHQGWTTPRFTQLFDPQHNERPG